MTDPTARIAGLSPKKRALLLARLKERRAQPGGGEDAIPVQPRPSGPGGLQFPVSFSQLREWILDRLDPGSAAYNIPLALELNERIDLPVLAGAVAELVARHETLRTGIRMPTAGEGPVEANEPVQVVWPRLRPPLPVVDLTGVPRSSGLRAARHLETLHAALPFRLDQAPLFRVALIRLGARDDRLLLSMHHIISDGWSMSVLARDLGELYRARAAGEEPRLPALPVQYGDFAAWQRRTVRGEVLERLVAFWRDELAGAPPAVELPTDRPRSATADRPAASLDLTRRSRNQKGGLVGRGGS
ncbi:MAG: condensation domain-containing protein, partial [Thermoanaerobaculia bacterium]